MNRCFLCNGEKSHIIHKGVRDDPDIDVLKCEDCGLVRLSKITTDDSYYIRSQMRKDNSEENIKEILTVAKRDDLRRYDFIKDMIENKRYLDFGCGVGGVLRYSLSETKESYGVELEDDKRRAIEEEGIICYRNIDDALRSLDCCVDVVSMFHVLEHLQNPIQILEKIRQLLTMDGIVIIEIPNADDALISVYNCEAFKDFTYWSPHLYLYNNAAFCRLMKRAQYKILFLTQIQRYPLSNTLYWLSKGFPNGHKTWRMLSNEAIDKLYSEHLASLGIADTIMAVVKPVR